jgi:hypothetical protein
VSFTLSSPATWATMWRADWPSAESLSSLTPHLSRMVPNLWSDSQQTQE